MSAVLYGTESINVCAYCKKHKANMTPKQMKRKQCLSKQCFHFVKNDDHPIWEQRQRLKEKKKQKKLERSMA